MEEIKALQELLKHVNYLYVGLLILITWLINEHTIFRYCKISKALKTLIVGVILILIFVYIFDYRTKIEIFRLFISLCFAMAIYKLGISTLLDKLK